jgi:hypothetical protein
MSPLAGPAPARTVTAMTRLRSRRLAPGSSRLRRAVTQLEFALVLPAFLFLMLFTVDMGHLILVSGAMQDATFSAARTGSQIGGAGLDGQSGALACPGSGTCSGGSTYGSLTSSADQVPSVSGEGKIESMEIVHGAICRNSSPDNHVVVRVVYSTHLLMPGLTTMLNMVSGRAPAPDGAWTLTSTAAVRCEITR